jgi:hypothetical protein
MIAKGERYRGIPTVLARQRQEVELFSPKEE